MTRTKSASRTEAATKRSKAPLADKKGPVKKSSRQVASVNNSAHKKAPKTFTPKTSTSGKQNRTSATNGGVKRVRDPEGMQRKILDAATAEFASHGYGGARIERISRRARTVDRMLYYYFGSKEKLFRAVLEAAYDKLGRAEQQLDLAGTPAAEGMRHLIKFTWDYYIAHPEFIRLLNNENQYRGLHLKKSQRVTELSFPMLSIVRDLLARGAKEKVFRRNLDATQIYVTIAALGYFYLSNRYTLSRFLDRDLLAEQHRTEWLQHITDVVMNHVSKR